MFVFLTSPIIGQMLVNPDLVTCVISVQGKTNVCFAGDEDEYVVAVKESVDEVYMIFTDAERRARK